MTIDGAAARKILPHLLAALVLLHVVTAVFVGLGPVPTSDVANSRKALQHVADTMRLDDADRFIALVDRVGGAWNGARTGTRKAMDPLWRHLGTAQYWRMFSGTIRGTARIEIAVRTGDGAWEDVYVQGSRETLWRHHTFDHYRWREYGKCFRANGELAPSSSGSPGRLLGCSMTSRRPPRRVFASWWAGFHAQTTSAPVRDTTWSAAVESSRGTHESVEPLGRGLLGA